MGRNSSGTYSAPVGHPVVSGTAISSATENALVSDLAAELTDSLSRSGKGGMTAPLKGTDGTAAAPAVSFTAEPGSGWFRIAAARLGAAISGVLRLEVNATGVTVPNDLAVTGAITFGSLGSQAARSNLPTVGQQVSPSCGTGYTNATNVYSDVTNLAVTMATTGRPVILSIQPDGANGAALLLSTSGSRLALVRDSTILAAWVFDAALVAIAPSLVYLDAPVAGTYTWKVQAGSVGISPGTTGMSRYVLTAYEL